MRALWKLTGLSAVLVVVVVVGVQEISEQRSLPTAFQPPYRQRPVPKIFFKQLRSISNSLLNLVIWEESVYIKYDLREWINDSVSPKNKSPDVCSDTLRENCNICLALVPVVTKLRSCWHLNFHFFYEEQLSLASSTGQASQLTQAMMRILLCPPLSPLPCPVYNQQP